MHTGMHPRNHGLWTNGLLLPQLPLTLAEHLRQQGFATASIGKIHFTPCGGDVDSWESRKRFADMDDAYEDTGPYAGFDHVELMRGHGAQPTAHFGSWFFKNGGTTEMLAFDRDEGIHDFSCVRKIPPALHPSSFVAERSCAMLEKYATGNRPFFLHVGIPDPHHPYDPPEAEAAAVDAAHEPAPLLREGELADRPAHYAARRDGAYGRKGISNNTAHPGGESRENTATLRARTTAMVNLLDKAVGRILQTLEDRGLAENTLVVFTSDHGDALGDHGLWGKGPYYYRSVINTPLIFKGPGIATGVSQKLISDVDLAPTLCEAVGASPLPFADGISVLPHLHDPTKSTREVALVEHRNGFGEHDIASMALVTESSTYVRYQSGEEELNDLDQDPNEFVNAATLHPERCGKLRVQMLDTIMNSLAKGPEQVSQA